MQVLSRATDRHLANYVKGLSSLPLGSNLGMNSSPRSCLLSTPGWFNLSTCLSTLFYNMNPGKDLRLQRYDPSASPGPKLFIDTEPSDVAMLKVDSADLAFSNDLGGWQGGGWRADQGWCGRQNDCMDRILRLSRRIREDADLESDEVRDGHMVK